jgi:hypothetical protein
MLLPPSVRRRSYKKSENNFFGCRRRMMPVVAEKVVKAIFKDLTTGHVLD